MEQLPDLKHWRLHTEFTIQDAVLLWMNIDPSAVTSNQLREVQPAYKTVYGAIVTALDAGELNGTRPVDAATGIPIPYEEDEEDVTRVTRESLAKWALQKGESPIFLREELEHLTSQADTQSERGLPFECPNYLAPWIRLILQAQEEHWQGYDPNDTNMKSPSNSEVADWLMKQKVRGEKVPQDAAKVIARIIRPLDAPTGRRRDTDDEKYS